MAQKTNDNKQRSDKAQAERIQKLVRLIERFGYYNLDKTQLAEEFGVSRKTLYEDIKAIKERGVDVVDMPLIKIEMHRFITSAHAIIMRKINDPSLSESDRINYIKVGYEGMQEERRFLEDFGVLVTPAAKQEGFAAFSERAMKEREEQLEVVK